MTFSSHKFSFIDLFSGIGGFHLALSRLGGECTLASDIDPIANESYLKNFKMKPFVDIKKIKENKLPDFDLLCGGFPCQSFSNIGPKGGLADDRGALVFDIFRILRAKYPKAFILENVKGLVRMNEGREFKIIKDNLRNLGYKISYEILEAKNFDLPQLRKRIFIVGVREDFKENFTFPFGLPQTKNLTDVLGGKTNREFAFTIRVGGRHSGINNKFNWDSYLVDGEPRYITVPECLELQGFPRDFYLAGNESQKYKQVGNSVPVNIVHEIGKQLLATGVFTKL